jgi:hypothetical protein
MKRAIIDWLGTACIIVAVFIAVNAVVSVSGCAVDQTQKQAAYEEAVALIDASAAEAAELRKKPNMTPEEIAVLAKAEATIAMLQEKLAAAVDAEGQFDEVKGMQMVTDFIPPPWNVPASLLIGSIGTWIKGGKTRATFKSLVESINKVKADDPILAGALKDNKTTFAANMGPKATSVLDKAIGGSFPVV